MLAEVEEALRYRERCDWGWEKDVTEVERKMWLMLRERSDFSEWEIEKNLVERLRESKNIGTTSFQLSSAPTTLFTSIRTDNVEL